MLESLDLYPAYGAKRACKRIGRGHGSGNGKTAGKGHKGQKARSGGSIRRGFEGGQMPLQRRVPKRGFNNIFAVRVAEVNVGKLKVFEENFVVDSKSLIENGIIKRKFKILKIIGEGRLNRKLTVKANKFSESAKKKIELAGGIAEVV